MVWWLPVFPFLLRRKTFIPSKGVGKESHRSFSTFWKNDAVAKSDASVYESIHWVYWPIITYLILLHSEHHISVAKKQLSLPLKLERFSFWYKVVKILLNQAAPFVASKGIRVYCELKKTSIWFKYSVKLVTFTKCALCYTLRKSK